MKINKLLVCAIISLIMGCSNTMELDNGKNITNLENPHTYNAKGKTIKPKKIPKKKVINEKDIDVGQTGKCPHWTHCTKNKIAKKMKFRQKHIEGCIYYKKKYHKKKTHRHGHYHRGRNGWGGGWGWYYHHHEHGPNHHHHGDDNHSHGKKHREKNKEYYHDN